jgi:peptidoglycan hydrolase CwlO-like protein
MSQEEITRIEEKFDNHIAKYDDDYKKLLWWIVGTLVTILILATSTFKSIGSNEQKISQLETNQKDFVTRAELTGTIALFNNKMDNLSEKIDRLINLK